MNDLLLRARRLVEAALGKSSPLVLARLGSAALTFALPLALVRLLEPEAFGTYKQFFLVAQTVLLIGQLGITQSLFYFLPRGGAERGAYVVQAVTSLAVLGALFGTALFFGAPLIGRWVGSGELQHLAAPLAIFAGLMLAAAPLEGALTSERRIGGSALAYVLTDGARAGSMIAAARWGVRWLGPAAIFWAAACVAALRVCALGLLLARRVLPAARPRLAFFRPQLAFALPFAGACLLYVLQRYCSQYVVSARFDAATFALFTVASFHLPVVDIVFTPITEVLMVELGRTLGADAAASRAAWHDAIDKLTSILFPCTAAAWLFGPTVLPLLFTHRYQSAVPLFLLTTLEIPIWILPVDALLRSAGDMRFLFGFNTLRIAVTVGLVLLGIHVAGLQGAILGGLTSETLARTAMLWRGRRFLGSPGLPQLLDWPTIGRVAAASALACLPALAVKGLLPAGARMLVAAGATYGIAYLVLRNRLLRGRRAEPTVTPAPAVSSGSPA